MDKYRLLEHKDEIFNMVQKAPVMELGEIWQTLPLKREVYKITQMEVLSEALIFSTTLPFEFDKFVPIFIKINFKNLIFKLMPGEFKTYNNQLSCSYPKEAKALESRALSRTRLPKKGNVNLTIRTMSLGHVVDLKVSIEDVSESGLGIKASIVTLEHFQKGNVFKIIKVCGRQHLEEGTLTVRHASNKDQKAFVKVGLWSDKPFSDEFFKILREEFSKDRYAGIDKNISIT